MRLFIIGIVAFLVSGVVVAQTSYRAETIQFNHGLPSDFVHSTIKKEDNLYIATQRGLCLYDGYEFIKNPKVNSFVSYLALHENNLFYYDHNIGLVKLANIFSQPKVLVKVNFYDATPNNDHFDHIYIDSKGLLWCSDQNNIKYFSPSTKKITSFLLDKNLIDFESKNTFLEPNTNEVWVATRKGMFVWNRTTKQWKPHPNAVLQQTAFIATKLSKNKTQLYCTNNKGTFFTYNISKKSIESSIASPLQNKSLNIVTTFESAASPVALYTENELLLWNAKKQLLPIFSTKNKINHVLYDPETRFFWIATNHGLVKLTPDDNSIITLKVPLQKDKIVTSIVQDNKAQIWMCNGTNTLYQYANNTWKTYQHPNESIQFTALFCKDTRVIVSANKGVFTFQNNRIQPLLLVETGAKKAIVDTQNQLWVLPNKGPVKVYDFTTCAPKPNWIVNSDKYWSENQFNDIAMSKNGTIWLASWMPKDYGISFYEASKKRFTEINQLKNYNNEALFISDYYNRIAFTQKGNSLFSGYGGWNLVSPQGKIIHSLNTEKYNVANDHIEGIAEDDKGNIWFASAEGLNHYNFHTDKVARISQIDGLATDELIHGFCKLSDSKIALGTNFGCQIVALDKILTTKLVNKLQITVVKKDGKILPHTNNKIDLDYDFTELDIHFSALSFSEKEKIIYRYKFDTDTTWNYLGTNPKLSLVKLSPGKYNITVAVGDNLDNWQSKTLPITLTIRPPYYQTYWFYGILISIVLVIIYFINRYLVNQEKIKGVLKSDIKEAEMQTLRSQMNPHFMFNSINSINSYIIQNKSNEASKYLTTFSKLMRSILDNSKHRTIPLDKEIKTLDWYLQLEAVRLEHKFTYSIHCKETIDKETTPVPPLILQPFVENAIWHGIQNKKGIGHITIQIENEVEDTIKISITDDGIGRTASALLKKNQTTHKSYGIDITINRLQLLHPNNSVSIIDLYDTNNQSTGTQVVLIISC